MLENRNNKQKNSICVSDYQTFGLSNLRTIKPSDYRAFELLDLHHILEHVSGNTGIFFLALMSGLVYGV
jgi:hypothetical protein